MNIRILYCVLILGGFLGIFASPAVSLAQADQPGLSAPTANKVLALQKSPNKHRYWRHRGGKHPHYGSRRARS